MMKKLITAFCIALATAASATDTTNPYYTGVSDSQEWDGVSFIRYPMISTDGVQAGTINSGAAIAATDQATHLIASIFNVSEQTETCSSAGCEIGFTIGTTTWATSGSTIRCGIQDLASGSMPAHGDGTFDVYDDLAQGTDSMAAGAKTVTMSSGSTAVTQGEVVAVVCEFTNRAGSDSIQIAGASKNSGNDAANLPVQVFENPAGTYTAQQTGPNFWIKYDSGEYGFPVGAFNATVFTTQNYNNGSSPSRWGNLIQVPVPVKACGWSFNGSLSATGRDANIILNEEQTDGTFTAVPNGTVNLLADQTSSASNRTISGAFPACIELAVGKRYFLELVPTTANSIALTYMVAASNELLGANVCGRNCYRGVRSDATSAPTLNTNYLTSLSLLLDGFQSGICRGGTAESC